MHKGGTTVIQMLFRTPIKLYLQIMGKHLSFDERRMMNDRKKSTPLIEYYCVCYALYNSVIIIYPQPHHKNRNDRTLFCLLE